MVYARKRKATRRNGPPSKKRRTMPARRRGSAMANMNLIRTSYQGTTVFSSTSVAGFWQYRITAASMLPSFTELAAVFDEYKISAIKYTFRPRFDGYDVNDPVTSGTPSPLYMCNAHVINDPGSSMVPAGGYTTSTLNTFLENGKVKSYPLTKPFSVYYRPKILQAALGGGTGVLCKAAPWIRTIDADVTHRGFHMFIQNNAMFGTNPSIVLDTFVTFYMKFRGAK